MAAQDYSKIETTCGQTDTFDSQLCRVSRLPCEQRLDLYGRSVFLPIHRVSLALQSLVGHMLHDLNTRLHPIASTTADQLCMGVAGDAPQALSISKLPQGSFRYSPRPMKKAPKRHPFIENACGASPATSIHS